MEQRRQGLYFEDFEMGQKIATPARTITEADIVNFAGVSGDYNALHTDETFAKNTPYGERIAHGILILAVSTGLAARQGFLEGTTLAFREVSWKFSAPVFIGDTVYMVVEVAELKPMPKLGGGLVVLKAVIINQAQKTVQRGEWRLLMKIRPTDD